MTQRLYTTQLQAGLGMQAESAVLLDLWQSGMDAGQLFDVALSSGRFPNVTARRLRNIVSECFAPRYLRNDAQPALLLQAIRSSLTNRELQQLLFIYTARANAILADFVRDVYWGAYISGRHELSNEEARAFVIAANAAGRTGKKWADSTVRRVAAYLTGCCSDFGLLERSSQGSRRILPFRIEPRIATLLAYDLHFSNIADNALASHEDWALFGLDRAEVIGELRQVSLRGLVVVQSAADVIRISWPIKSLQEVANALTKR